MTVWISHRGYAAEALENSQEAFDAAIALGFRHLETDLRCSKDGRIILNHDRSLRHSCGLKKCVDELSSQEIGLLRTKKGEPLFDFEAFIKRYAAFDWTFDIKRESATATLKALKQWVLHHKAEDWLCQQGRFLLWTAQDAKLALTLFPRMPQLAGERACYRAGLACLLRMPTLGGIEKGKTYSLPRYFAGIDLFRSEVTASYHASGARVLAYLPPRLEDAKAAVAASFDEILTNDRPLI